MSKGDFEPFKTPALGRWIARLFVTLGLASPTANDAPSEARPFDYLPAMKWFARILAPIWVALVCLVLWALWKLASSEFSALDPTDKRWHVLAIAAMIASLGGLISAPLALIRVQVNERQTKAQEAQRHTAEQGHITDRFTKAVEQLGAEKTVYRDGQPHTEPNLEVRLGAIYALERIAQDSARDHIPIMETLSAYIRQNTNAGEPKDFPLGQELEDIPYASDDPEDTYEAMISCRREYWRDWLESLGPAYLPRLDVEAAVKVIGRRTEQQRAIERAAKPPFRLELSRANLQRVNLSGADLSGADLSSSRLTGAELYDADLTGADLTAAQMEGAKLANAIVSDANFRGARMEAADFRNVQAQKADFSGAKMELSNFSFAIMDGALLTEATVDYADFDSIRLKKADLRKASFINCRLNRARLQHSDLRSANFWRANLSGATLNCANLQVANLSRAKLDRATVQNADLSWSKMENTDLSRADLKGCDLAFWVCARTNARSADFTEAKNMSQEQVNSLFGDEETKLPAADGAGKPLRRTTLMQRPPGEESVYSDYDVWIADGAPPGEPVED